MDEITVYLRCDFQPFQVHFICKNVVQVCLEIVLPLEYKYFCRIQIRECDQSEVNIHLYLRNLNLLVIYWNFDIISLVQGGCWTCKIYISPTMIHHIICTQMISIINYIFIHIISKYIQNYQLLTNYLCDVWYNKIKHDKKKNNTWCP